MTVAEPSPRITTALRHAHDRAGFAPSPPRFEGAPAAAAARPVPLDRLIGAWNITFDEVPGLTAAAAGAYLMRWGRELPHLFHDAAPLAGFIFAWAPPDHGGGGGAAAAYVLVNGNDPFPRRRFTAAHELGHFLLHFPPAAGTMPATVGDGDGTDAGADPRTLLIRDEPTSVREATRTPGDAGFALPAPADVPSLPWREREANRFAAELLMPEAVVRVLHGHYTSRFGDAPRFVEGHIAGDLLVSRQAVRYRLADLGLGDGGGGGGDGVTAA